MSKVPTGGIISAVFLLFLAMLPAALARPLNPAPSPNTLESLEDRYFRIAFTSATAGDFDTAIINYQRAAAVARSQCERHHAEAGVQAANQGKEVLKKYGSRARPTQGFWSQLRELTASLPCVKVR